MLWLYLTATSFFSQKLSEPRIDCHHNVLPWAVWWVLILKIPHSTLKRRTQLKLCFQFMAAPRLSEHSVKPTYSLHIHMSNEVKKKLLLFVSHPVYRNNTFFVCFLALHWSENEKNEKKKKAACDVWNQSFKSPSDLEKRVSFQMHHTQDLWNVIS